MIKKFKLKLGGDGLEDPCYLYRNKQFFCVVCFKDLFEGDVTDSITLVLSSKPSAGAYKAEHVKSNKYRITLSNGSHTYKHIYNYTLHAVIEEYFGTVVYFSFED